MFGAYKQPIALKAKRLTSYLEEVHSASNRIVDIGSAYNLIRDTELKSSCSDLLSGRDHFDRITNQATQVLEDGIRLKVPQAKEEIGIKPVNATKKIIQAIRQSSFQKMLANRRVMHQLCEAWLEHFETLTIIDFLQMLRENMRYKFVRLLLTS